MIMKIELTPPKGILCNNITTIDELESLQDIGMTFSDKFSVHIDCIYNDSTTLVYSSSLV